MTELKKHFKIGKLFGETFNLYTQNFLTLLYPALAFFGGTAVLIYLFYDRSFAMMNPDSDALMFSAITFAGSIALSVLFLVYNFYQTRLSSNCYLGKEEAPADLISLSLKKALPLLGLGVLYMLGVMAAMFLFLIPGYILMLGWSLCFVVFAVEGKGARASLKRSWALTKGYKGKLFLVFLILIIVMYAVVIVIFLLGQSTFSAFIVGLSQNLSGSDMSMISLLMAALYLVLYSLIYPLITVLLVVIHYSILKDKEGFSTERLAQDFMA